MAPQKLREWIEAKPFVPFRIHLDDGRTFDVTDPYWIKTRQKLVVVAKPLAENPRVYERVSRIGTDYITTIEPISATKPID